jgi:hypothetical protein
MVRAADGALLDDLVIPQGTAWNRTWTVADDDGIPLPVDGWSVRSQIRSAPSSGTVLFEWNTTGGLGPASIDGPTVTVELTGLDSLLWTFRRAYYDVYLTNPSGEPTRLVQGTVTVSPAVTH